MADPNCSSERKDWAEQSSNLLPLIAHKLDNIFDFIRFRFVCQQWRSATELWDNPPQFPWLMILELYRKPNISFIALPSTKIFSIPFHRLSKKISPGSEFKLDKTYPEDDELSILSLDVSGGQAVDFPPIGNITQFFSLKSYQQSEIVMHVPYMRDHAHHMKRFFWYNYRDTTTRPHVVVRDDTTPNVVSKISCPEESVNGCWLISTRDGVLLVVHNNAHPQYGFNDAPYVNHQFVVYGLENYNDDKQPRWTKLSGIDDMMLFLDDCNGFSLMASDYDQGYRGNCIYFITHFKKNPIVGEASQCEYVLLGFDMGENKCFEVRSLGEATAFGSEIYWFIPYHTSSKN